MMITARSMLVCTVTVAALVAGSGPPLRAQPQAAGLKNPGFELRAQGGAPDAWNKHQAGGADDVVTVDAGQRHGGSYSLRLRHAEAASTTLESAPVRLRVGRLYRLSGWIRTEGVRSDPLSRYPTAVPAALSMTSFPFTNHSPAVGGTREWTRVEQTFFATHSEDRVRVHLGVNGVATGTAWFDDLSVEEVTDITQHIPLERVRWHGPAFRYTDGGWTFVHIEGEPFDRGYQYGYLLATEIASYIDKLAIQADQNNAEAGWNGLRMLADALMLRNYDEEYLVEMRGIAAGAARGGAVFARRPVDFLDIVTVNSVVDIGQLSGALAKTAHPLSGRDFRPDEQEMSAGERLHKCSSFLANGPASADGRIVFAQLFMWGGYTGVHWDVICDVMPSSGKRLVYETFPGGIHSAADFYINDAGIMIGETTVMQTPFDVTGEPQSSRIRKAAQYATSIDDVVRILTTRNNGLYTNDWLIADAKTDETAILLLGTKAFKLWRSSKKDFPGGTTGFYWSVNNAKDPEVRKEYVPDPTNAPFDVVFSPVNRDIAFVEFYRAKKGRIDAPEAARIVATSPINRPHACDGKVTTSEMAAEMVFMAHYGKVTHREKFPEKGSRRMPDLPNAIPHLALGYTVFSPKYVVDELKARHAGQPAVAPDGTTKDDLAAVRDIASFDRTKLWYNTVYPATDADNWFVSGSAAYWRILSDLPADLPAASSYLRDQLAELNCRLLYTVNREGSLAPSDARRRYDRYADYVIPRVRGVFLLHQLRLILGNEVFSRLMNTVHARYRGKPMATSDFVRTAREVTGEEIGPLVAQWVEREDLPAPALRASAARSGDLWRVVANVSQTGRPYRFKTSMAVETPSGSVWTTVAMAEGAAACTLTVKDTPLRAVFNAGQDIPVAHERYYTMASILDDFADARLVYGTSSEIEANHTMALRYQSVLADQFVELMLPVQKDCELSWRERDSTTLIMIDGSSANTAAREMYARLGLEVGDGMFRWRGRTLADPDDGMMVAYPNPANPRKPVFLVIANSALQLYHMTRRYQSLPSWALFTSDRVTEKGYHPVERLAIDITRE